MKLPHCSSPFCAMPMGVGRRIMFACALLRSNLEIEPAVTGLTDSIITGALDHRESRVFGKPRIMRRSPAKIENGIPVGRDPLHVSAIRTQADMSGLARRIFMNCHVEIRIRRLGTCQRISQADLPLY